MRTRAEHLGYSTAAYRGIGAIEIAAAGGILMGGTRPSTGMAAGTGPVLSMSGAVAGHLRRGDGIPEIAPAAGTALVAAMYTATPAGAS